MGRTEKGATIAELRQKLGTARGAVLTDFRGLNVAELTELRNLLRKNAVDYRVVKNTLATLAVQGTDLQELAAYFEGPTGVAISQTDPVAASKVLSTWAKTRPRFSIKGGMVEREVVGAAEIASLADLPPREVLLARVAGAFWGPLQGLATVLAGPVRALASVLDQVRQHKDKSA